MQEHAIFAAIFAVIIVAVDVWLFFIVRGTKQDSKKNKPTKKYPDSAPDWWS